MSWKSDSARVGAGAGGSSLELGSAAARRRRRNVGRSAARRARAVGHVIEPIERRLLLAVDLFGTPGPDSIVVSSTASQTSVTINGALTTIPVSAGESVRIHAGAGDDVIVVHSTRMLLIVNGEAGDDSIFLAPTGENLDSIEAEVQFNGGADSDSAVLDDRNNDFDDSFEITETEVFRGFFGGLVYSATESITLNTGFASSLQSNPSVRAQRGRTDAEGGSGNNTIDIHSLPAHTSLTINAGGGNDSINFAPTGQLLDLIEGPVTVNGEDGVDSLNLFDVNNAFPDIWEITATSASREAFGGVTYGAIEELRIQAGLFSSAVPGGAAPGSAPGLRASRGGPESSGDNTFNIASLSVPTTINGGAGNDIFHVGSQGELAPLLSMLRVNGQSGIDELILDDTANADHHTYVLTAETILYNGVPLLTYLGMERVTMNLGGGNNLVQIESTAANAPVTLRAGAGDDLINIDADSANLAAGVTVDGQAGDDRLVIHDPTTTANRNYNVTDRVVNVTGMLAPLITYLNLTGLQLNASAGDNIITVSETDPLTPLTVLSGAGDDQVLVNPDNTGSAVVLVGGIEELASLSIGSGGLVRITASGANVLRLGQLNISGTGTLDVADNSLILDYADVSPLGSVRNMITSGYAGSAWTGSGITSSTAAALPQRGVGYGEASAIFSSFPATFAGQSVDNTTVLVRYTRYGDANLDRVVNLADFNRLAGNFGTGSLWTQGNFNFDGFVNLADFNRLAANFGLSAAAEDGPTGRVSSADGV